jgi:hypothetical protein
MIKLKRSLKVVNLRVVKGYEWYEMARHPEVSLPDRASNNR